MAFELEANVFTKLDDAWFVAFEDGDVVDKLMPVGDVINELELE